ncbi:hypothetical protein [Oryza sativa Japonica Group]|uniref:Uncharacterized protein n=1 Tax=Oryza sativa subsp. japonica TaxID=39947 RepID=Q5SNF7_ORYSJ|nr:hypothetical protein [Oryza sativa Japonica Group]
MKRKSQPSSLSSLCLTWAAAAMAVVTATVLRGSGGRRGSRRGRGAAVESSRHWLRPLDRLGFMGWSGGGMRRTSFLVSLCRPVLHPSLYGTV